MHTGETHGVVSADGERERRPGDGAIISPHTPYPFPAVRPGVGRIAASGEVIMDVRVKRQQRTKRKPHEDNEIWW